MLPIVTVPPALGYDQHPIRSVAVPIDHDHGNSVGTMHFGNGNLFTRDAGLFSTPNPFTVQAIGRPPRIVYPRLNPKTWERVRFKTSYNTAWRACDDEIAQGR